MMCTVFFGPFIGEFGWELLHWHAWVRQMCITAFRDHRKIACSFPGRQPFYPCVEEFWPLPSWWLERAFSGHNYIVDGWRNGYPGFGYRVRYRQYGVLPRWQAREEQLTGIEGERAAEKLLESLADQLPDDTVFFVPWRRNEWDGLVFGTWVEGVPTSTRSFYVRPIPFDRQLLEKLEPTRIGGEIFRSSFPDVERMIALFPRYRPVRRVDKNWSQNKYLELIRGLRDRFPDFPIAIVGEPAGAYFADGVPEGCLDLIHLPPDRRMDIQIAALQRAALALGGMSGAILVALAAGCPSLTWGGEGERLRYHHENFMGTRFVYHPVMDAEVQHIIRLGVDMLEERIPDQPQREFSGLHYLRFSALQRFLARRS